MQAHTNQAFVFVNKFLWLHLCMHAITRDMRMRGNNNCFSTSLAHAQVSREKCKILLQLASLLTWLLIGLSDFDLSLPRSKIERSL